MPKFNLQSLSSSLHQRWQSGCSNIHVVRYYSHINHIHTASRQWKNIRRDSSSDSNNSHLKNDSFVLKVAIVGSGPSGCYTAKYLRAALTKLLPTTTTSTTTTTMPSLFRLDIFERLPTPFGLVRFGVAPDHPEVKNVQNDFTELFQQQHDEVQLIGNVHVGTDVSLQELRQWYDIVVLAYGCEADRKLNIPGEDTLQGVLSAREFVAWYNGHPDFVHLGEQVAAAFSRSASSNSSTDPTRHDVVVLGHGNVALDCARILAKGASGLYETDVASHALPILAQQQQQQQHDGSSHQCISIIGRRGHVQGAFTIKELRELTKLQEEGYGVKFHVLSEELDLGLTPASKEELAGPSGRPKTRIDKLLRDNAQASSNKTTDTRQVVLRFLLNPIRFEPDPNDPSKLGGVVCERTALVGDAGHQRAIGTGQLETIPAHLALVSIGYKGTPLPGLEPYFDEQRGTVKNHHGKVIMVNDEGHDGGLGKLYVSGWLKRGPSGIIGTNIVDAKDTVATIVKDLEEQLPLQPRQDRRSKDCNVMQLLEQRGVQVVDWPAYERIDTAETNPTAKRSEKQPREKITTRLKLLEAART